MATVEKLVGLGSAMAGLALLWSNMPENVRDEARMATVEKWVGLGSMAGLALLWSKMTGNVRDEVDEQLEPACQAASPGHHFWRLAPREWTKQRTGSSQEERWPGEWIPGSEANMLYIPTLMPMVASYFNPYEQVIISEYNDEQLRRSKLFDAIEAYLGERCLKGARKLKADVGKESDDLDSDLPQPQLQVTLDENQDITDTFEGARVWWKLSSRAPKDRGNVISTEPEPSRKEPRLYRAVFHKRHRQLVLGTYLRHIVLRRRELTVPKTHSRLFTYSPSEGGWTHVLFEHPATFDHLAMDPDKKKEIIDDLRAFQQGKDYYSKVGKAWKRGYLLYGPPGTGKSTLISAMANFLKYDVYDLPLTSVRSNDSLRNLFVHTPGKSITVIEDIDAIEVDHTTKRKNTKDDGENILVKSVMHDSNRVTLSGLLSFVDGLWSACGRERIMVFKTNHVDRLDPALARRGRMDMHIEMPYCRFEAFKVLARNYLDVTEHQRFREIRRLLEDEETNMSPADVTHYLMPKCNKRKRDADECLYKHLHKYRDDCLAGLVEALKKAKKDSAAATFTQQKGKAKKFRD